MVVLLLLLLLLLMMVMMVLRAQVTGQQDASVIYPPVLTIEYSERKPSTFAATPALGNVTITFEVHYTTDFTFFWTFAIVLFTLCMVLTFIHCCIRMLNWSRRSTRTYPERALTLSVLMRMAAYLAGSFATFSFWYVQGCCVLCVCVCVRRVCALRVCV